MKNATRLAVCGISTALCVVLLFFGGVSFFLAYAMPMLAGMFMIMLKNSFGASAAWTTYVSSSVLSFLLVADRECVLMYIMFFGFYPIIQSSVNRIKMKAVQWVVKLLLFNVVVFLVQVILVYVFGIPFLEEGEGRWLILFFAALMNVLFVSYDIILSKLTAIYIEKLESRIKKYFK